MKKFAFTTVEILITLSILGIIASSIFVVSQKTMNIKEKKAELISKNFYNNVNNIIENIAVKNNATGIKNMTSVGLMEKFREKLDAEGNSGDCSKLISASFETNKYVNNAGLACSDFPSRITAGFYVYENCNNVIRVKEYKSKNMNFRTAKNVCGYIVYQIEDSKGIFGEDLFVIALGNKHLK